jgi:dolichol kinase
LNFFFGYGISFSTSLKSIHLTKRDLLREKAENKMRKTSDLNRKAHTDSLSVELKRKSSHLFVLIFPISLHCLHLKLWLIQLVLLILVITILFVELYRIRINRNFFINRFTRKKEKTEMAVYFYSTTIWFLIFLSANYYDFAIAELVILSTHLGDGAAAIIGKTVGRYRLILTEHKTWEGFFAGVIVTLFSGGIFLLTTGYTDKLWWAIIPGFVVGILDFFEDLPTWTADNILNPSISLIILLTLESF